MRYKDQQPKRRKLKATDEIRNRYAAKPIICLYHDESDAIIDHVMQDDSTSFYEWLGQWDRFIFKEANFVVKPRAKGESMYAAYKVQGRNLLVSVFSENTSDAYEFMVNPDYIDPESFITDAIISINEHGEDLHNITMPVPVDFMNEFAEYSRAEDAKFGQQEAELMEQKMNIEKSFGGMTNEQLMEKAKALPDTPENKIYVKFVYDELSKHVKILNDLVDNANAAIVSVKERRDVIRLNSMARVTITILTALYHFQVRQPKVYLDGNESHTEGYKRWNKDYNPMKRLTPPAIVRPKNGTRSWFEQQRQRLTESWHVKGHTRVLRAARYKEKRGQTIWISDFVKGSGENMRLSIYADQVTGADVVEIENND